MKIFTKKIFMLSAAMLLTVGVNAQINHRFPAVKFLYGDRTYILPAWDVMFGSGGDESMTHVQAKEAYQYNQGQTVKSKIVSRFGVTEDNDFFTSFAGNGDVKIKILLLNAQGEVVKDEDGNVMYVASGEDAQGNPVYDFTVKAVTYQQALPNHTFNSTQDAGRKLFNYSPTFEQNEYTITTTKTYNGVTFDIDEIDAWAYRGQKTTSGTFATIAAKKVIIPAAITKIGKGAFSFISSEEIEFADDSPITSLSPAIFMCSNFKKITLPASLTEIRGAAFGGMKSTLTNIIFKGNTAPTFKKDDKFENNEYTCDAFTAIPRLSTSNVTPARCIIEVPLGTVQQYADVEYADTKPLKNFVLSSKITLGANGKMTYCSEEDFTVKQYNTAYTSNNDKWEDGAMKAYYVKNSIEDVNLDDGKVYLTQITEESKIPGWSKTGEGENEIIEDFGVFFRGEANESYSIFYPYDKMTNKLSMSETQNCLKGVVEKTPIKVVPESEDDEVAEYSFFILSKTTGNFRRITTNGNCQANRAYIMIKDGGYDPTMGTEDAKELTVSFPEETGIATHEVKSVQNDAWYTLQGIQVNQPSKGIFIKNGKKFVIK